jgi:arginine decarboxylase-like protein
LLDQAPPLDPAWEWDFERVRLLGLAGEQARRIATAQSLLDLYPTNAEVLEAMEHNPELLLERLRVASEAAIQRGDLKISDARRLMDHLETSLRQTTYLQA